MVYFYLEKCWLKPLRVCSLLDKTGTGAIGKTEYPYSEAERCPYFSHHCFQVHSRS